MIEIKRKFADCRLRTADLPCTLPIADCRLKTAYLPYLLMTIMFLVTCTIELHPTIRYVSHTGSSTPPYTSWETAADSIQKAIDICLPGDTVLVANGVYYEALYVDKTIHLIGSSMDSTVIDGTNITGYDIIYFFENNSTFKNFTITSTISQRTAINTWKANIIASFCRIDNLTIPLLINISSVHISNFIIYAYDRAIRDECFPDTCRSVYTNNLIISRRLTSNTPVWFGFGGYPVFSNNILIEENTNRWIGIYAETSGAVIKNNLISGFYHSGIRLYQYQLEIDSVYNNLITDMVQYAIETSPGGTLRTVNNIFQRNGTALISYSSPARLDYNLFWDVQNLVANQPFMGDSNIIADPMFIKDTIPRTTGSYDFHLQAYSPAIDAGDPSILDIDGSRSDMGMYGGPLGESYKYKDLAPRPPRNLSAVVDSSQILVKWNRNTEADTSHYNVYRDTVANFTIDSTKLISLQTDTSFIQYAPYLSSRYVYKITCVDNQGNESLPSEELVVNITTVDGDPMTVNDYLLYQNYPNPFNPSTTIAYKLKERTYVKLMVYDIKGELISVLVNKEQESGYYEAEFNVGNGLLSVPNSLASGIYLYRIEVIGEGRIPVYSEMKKMLLIK